MDKDWWKPDPSKISTWALLPTLGFLADESVRSDKHPGLSFDFGSFKLSAGYMLGRHLRPIVLISGLVSTKRTLSQIWHELPNELESEEQGKAFLAYYLSSHAEDMAIVPTWLTEGLTHQHLLPWEQENAAREREYAARPHCYVERDWLRLALKKLSEYLCLVDDDTLVSIGFDGAVLTIYCSGLVSAIPAKGSLWQESYDIKAGVLRQLPKRLTGEAIELSIGRGVLWIGHRGYSGIVSNVEGIKQTDQD